MSRDLDAFTVLSVWPRFDTTTVTAADLAEELSVDAAAVVTVMDCLIEARAAEAVTSPATSQGRVNAEDHEYELTGMGVILASQPDGGRSLATNGEPLL